MRMRLLITLLGLLLAACAGAPPKPAAASTPPQAATSAQPEPKTIEEACKTPEYQCIYTPVTVSLVQKDGSGYQHTFPPPMPVIHGGVVYVLAGQTVYIEADVDKDKLTNLHFVSSNTHPEKTLVLHLSQSTDAGMDNTMMFDIHSPFAKPLKYHAGLMPLDSTDGSMYKTSTCPVIAKGGAFEMWPYPVFQLALSDFHMLDPDSKDVGLCIF